LQANNHTATLLSSQTPSRGLCRSLTQEIRQREAIDRLTRSGKLPTSTKHRTSKSLNNIIEADRGALK
jgi:transposase-like protein